MPIETRVSEHALRQSQRRKPKWNGIAMRSSKQFGAAAAADIADALFTKSLAEPLRQIDSPSER